MILPSPRRMEFKIDKTNGAFLHQTSANAHIRNIESRPYVTGRNLECEKLHNIYTHRTFIQTDNSTEWGRKKNVRTLLKRTQEYVSERTVFLYIYIYSEII